MERYALTAIGPDRPGLVAAVTKALYRHKCAIGDSSMMLLDNEFTINLIMTLPKRREPAGILKDIKRLEQSENIAVNFTKLPPESGAKSPLSDFTVTMHGVQRPGVIHRAADLLRRLGVNITNLESKSIPGKKKVLYIVLIEAATPEGVPLKKIEGRLKTLARGLKMKITVRPIEAYTPI
ncbi:MAG: ACT domain-containing protein [Deltaproteobacteria bacterium]|nr:ACT domain-containing protein [Deltaproteobacteria bacterium]